MWRRKNYDPDRVYDLIWERRNMRWMTNDQMCDNNKCVLKGQRKAGSFPIWESFREKKALESQS